MARWARPMVSAVSFGVGTRVQSSSARGSRFGSAVAISRMSSWLVSAAGGFGFDGGLVGGAGLGQVGEVVLVGDLPALVFGGLFGPVRVEPFLGRGVALVGVSVDATGGQFAVGALFGSAGVRGV